MKSFSAHYKFSQSLNFHAKEAYQWCTDYQKTDIELMGSKGARKVQRINDDTIILTDTVIGQEKRTTKKRLVRLFPERLSWTNTRLSEEGKHSQFLYEIIPEGKERSRLDFTGSQVFYADEIPLASKIASIAEDLAEEDSSMWKRLAKAMEKDLGGK